MSQHHGARRSSTQLTLQAAFSHTTLPVLPTTSGPIDVVDLFCGVGGFSEGARLAGHRVVLAVDSNECALDAHKLNHPSAVRELATLPAENLQQLLPSAGTKWHLHGSPPCTKLSRAGGTNRSASDRAEGLFLVNWLLNLVAEVGCTTWSMEQVAQEDVLAELAARQKAAPSIYAYHVVNMAHLVQTTCLAQVHWATLAFQVHYAEVVLCICLPLLGGEAEQRTSLDQVHWAAHAFVVHCSEVELCSRVSLLGSES